MNVQDILQVKYKCIITSLSTIENQLPQNLDQTVLLLHYSLTLVSVMSVEKEKALCQDI